MSKRVCEFIGCGNTPINHTLKQFGHFLILVHTCNIHNLELHNTWTGTEGR